MKVNPILDAKTTGRRTTGVWLTLGNTFVAEMLGRMGFDWIVIDRQHGSIEWDAVGPAIQAIELGGLVRRSARVEWNSTGADHAGAGSWRGRGHRAHGFDRGGRRKSSSGERCGDIRRAGSAPSGRRGTTIRLQASNWSLRAS